MQPGNKNVQDPVLYSYKTDKLSKTLGLFLVSLHLPSPGPTQPFNVPCCTSTSVITHANFGLLLFSNLL